MQRVRLQEALFCNSLSIAHDEPLKVCQKQSAELRVLVMQVGLETAPFDVFIWCVWLNFRVSAVTKARASECLYTSSDPQSPWQWNDCH